MAGRIRSIKPEILDDEECCALSDEAWRLWVSAWCLADDHGNLRAGDRYLAALVWQDTARSPRVSEILRELRRANRLVIYTQGSERYAHVVNWEKHQRIDNAGKHRVPAPDNEDSRTWEDSRGTSPTVAESREDSRKLPLDQRPTTTTTTADHRVSTGEMLPVAPSQASIPGTEAPADPDAPHGRKADGTPKAKPGRRAKSAANPPPADDKPPLPFRFTAASRAVADAAGAAYTHTDEAHVRHIIAVEEAIRAHPTLDEWTNLGAWLATGGDAFPPDKGPSWLAKSEAMEAMARAAKWRAGELRANGAPRARRPSELDVPDWSKEDTF